VIIVIFTNIQDNLRRFKKEQYHLSRHEEILQFFAEFEDYLTEDEMWNLSETIKPRGQTNKGIK
jgi:Rap guanine nucleotide exchange factor 1